MKSFLLILTILFSVSAQAKTNVSFVPKSVKQGDAVELVISSDTPFQGVPNLEILQNDFVIGGQQKKQSAQWINGKGTTTYQLIYTLFPNKSGDITIKGLKIGTETLPEISLTVGNDAAYEQTGNLSLMVECPHKSLYPSQKLLCQVTLDDSIGLVDGEIYASETNAGTCEQLLPLSPSNQSDSTQRRYQSIFAFTPTQSGKIEIPPFTFKGQVRLRTTAPTRTSSMIDLMMLGFRNTATKPVAIQSNPIHLTVKEKPSDYQGWWLPSTNVTLTEKYDMPATLHTGEPITRTVTLFAQDIAAANLPIPSAAQTAGFKIYTNPEQRKDLPNGAELSVNLTFVPTQAGSLTLPQIIVPWFNTQTGTEQKAILPSKEIFVMADTSHPADISSQPKVSETPVIENKTPQPSTTQAPQDFPWLWIILSAIIAFVVGIVVTILILKKQPEKTQGSKKKAPLPDLYPF